jgi:outer membrane protein TolC
MQITTLSRTPATNGDVNPQPLPAPSADAGSSPADAPAMPQIWPPRIPPQGWEEIPGPRVAADAGPLTEQEVIDAMMLRFPLLAAIQQERAIAAGEQTAAWGNFDTQLAGSAIAAPLGFYENYRYNLGFEQPFWNGTKTFGGYMLGRGDIQPWYFERKTNEGGEFRAGFDTPLLRDRPIDKRRVAVRQAEISRRLAEPIIRKQQLTFAKESAKAYWSWVNAGRRYQIARNLFDISARRQSAIRRSVEQGAQPGLTLIENDRLLAGRQVLVTAAERKFQQSAISLSLFLRDDTGAPVIPAASRLPPELPPATNPDPRLIVSDIETARRLRPELESLRLYRTRVSVDLAEAQNQLQPGVDAVAYASKDVGYRADPKNDKGPFELELGVTVDVPFQRRMAQGKIRSSQAKMSQLSTQLRFAEDSIVAEIQDVTSALAALFQQINETRKSVQYNRELERLERRSFEQGMSNLFLVNLREQSSAEAEVLELDLTTDYFKTVAEYRATLGLLPGGSE